MKPTSKELDTLAKNYLIECIDLSGYDWPAYNGALSNFVTEREYKIAALNEIFGSEYGWRVDQVGKQGAIMDWLQGLPSSIGIEYANYNIIQLAKKWGSLPADATEREEDKILENYWNFMAAKLCQLFNESERETA